MQRFGKAQTGVERAAGRQARTLGAGGKVMTKTKAQSST